MNNPNPAFCTIWSNSYNYINRETHTSSAWIWYLLVTMTNRAFFISNGKLRSVSPSQSWYFFVS